MNKWKAYLDCKGKRAFKGFRGDPVYLLGLSPDAATRCSAPIAERHARPLAHPPHPDRRRLAPIARRYAGPEP